MPRRFDRRMPSQRLAVEMLLKGSISYKGIWVHKLCIFLIKQHWSFGECMQSLQQAFLSEPFLFYDVLSGLYEAN